MNSWLSEFSKKEKPYSGFTGMGGGAMGLVNKMTPPPSSSSYDYEFLDEVHYGVGSGRQNYHYSGDGTMPSISLGNPVYNWDMYFEHYQSTTDHNANSNDWVIANDGYQDNNGFLMGFYNAQGVDGQVSIAYPGGAYGIYTGYALPKDQWNWVKLEWRGGNRFRLWQKASENATWNMRVNVTSGVYNGTEWNYMSVGSARSSSGSGLSSQYYGKIRKIRLNVNSNVSNL
jgi:hypothetical protein